MIPTLNGNTIILNFETHALMCDFIYKNDIGINQYSVLKLEDKSWLFSAPCSKELEDQIPGIIHGARARAQDKPDPTPPSGGNNTDGTPPGGGTPGSTSVWQQTYTEARAA